MIRQLASDSGNSQSSIITSAIQMFADVKLNTSGTNDNVKQSVNSELLEDFRRQIHEKDELIRNQTGQINSLIRQNDQSQQLIGAFSRVGEGKLLEKKKGKKIGRTSSEEGSTTQKIKKKGNSKKGRSKKKKGKKK
jgi:hypothetical protein